MIILVVFSAGTWSSAQGARQNSIQGLSLGSFRYRWTVRQDSESALTATESTRSADATLTERVTARSTIGDQSTFGRGDAAAAVDAKNEHDVRDYSIASAANRMTSVSEAEADVERMMMPHHSEDPVMDMEYETRRMRMRTETSVRDSAFHIAVTSPLPPPAPPLSSSSLSEAEFTRNPIMIGD